MEIFNVHIKGLLILLVLVILLHGNIRAASNSNTPDHTAAVEDTTTVDFTRVDIDKLTKGLTVKGYYRFLTYRRNSSSFFGDVSRENSVTEGDDEFFAPTFDVRLGMTPTINSEVGIQFYGWTPLDGINPENNKFKLSRNGILLDGSFKTKKAGTYNLWMGGINYLRFSDFTLGTAQQVRTSLFDRTAWSYVFPTNVQYGNYYSTSDFQRDIVWGKRSVNGIGGRVTDLPGNYELAFLFGRTPFNLSSVPDNVAGVQLKKNIKILHTVGLNILNSNGKTNAINGDSYGSSTASLTYKGNVNEYIIEGELATSGWYTPGNDRVWDNAVTLSVRPPARLTKFPLKLELFYVGADFSNTHSSIINSSVEETQATFNGENVADGNRPTGGVLAPMHLKTNNRTGVNLNGEVKAGNFILNFGHSVSGDNEISSNTLSFYHKVTGLYLARNARFQQAYGPYGNLTTFFRGAYETTNLYDTTATGEMANSLKYNVDLINLKYSTKLFNRNLYVFYLGEYQSAQSSWSAIPTFNDDAYLRVFFQEIDIYYNIWGRLSLVGYLGRERIIGNEFTDRGENGGYRNQTANVIGAGFDVALGKLSSFYFRTKWGEFSDPNFESNRFKAFEGSVELKVYF